MSRTAMVVGLIASICLHVVLLGHAATEKDATQSNITEIPIVPVMLQEQLAQETPPEPKPQPQAAKPPVPKPQQPPVPPTPPQPQVQARRTPPPPSPVPPPTTTARATDVKTKGDYAGRANGQRKPALRINWGNARHAQQVLEQGQMKLVIIDTAQGRANITQQLAFENNQWHRTIFKTNVRIRFSNQLRIVDDVPAFRTAASAAALDSTKHLAVLVPNTVEQTLHAAQLAAAFERGLTMGQIRNFGGQFQLSQQQLHFEITQIQARRPQP